MIEAASRLSLFEVVCTDARTGLHARDGAFVSAVMTSVFVTRRLPGNAVEIPRRTCAVDVWGEDTPMPRHELLQQVAGRSGLITMLTDRVPG
jgi:hypothetical protein